MRTRKKKKTKKRTIEPVFRRKIRSCCILQQLLFVLKRVEKHVFLFLTEVGRVWQGLAGLGAVL